MQLKHLLLLNLFFFLISSSPCFSQVVDSLTELILQTKSEEKKVDLWNEISCQQLPIAGKEAAEKALNLAKKINYAKGKADANYFLSRYLYLKDQQVLAKGHALTAIELFESLNLKAKKAKSLILLGEILYYDKAYGTSLEYLKDAEGIAQQIEDDIILARIYETIAYIFIDGSNNKEKGKSYLLKSNDIFKAKGEQEQLMRNYLQLATFYMESNNIDSSLTFINEGEKFLNNKTSNISNNSIDARYNFLAIKGSCYAKKGITDSAELFVNQSLPFFIENDVWYSVAWAYSDLSLIAIKKGEYESAVKHAKKSIELDFTESFIEENTKLIRDAYVHLNQDSFHFYNEKYIALLADKKKITNINEIQEILKQEALVEKEKELIQEKSINRIIVLAVILLALFYGLSLLYFYKNPKSRLAHTPIKHNQGPDSMPQIIETEIDRLRQKVNVIERSLLSKEIDLERQRSSLDITSQHLKEIAEKTNPAELKKSLKELSNQLEYNQNISNQWEFFSQQFELIHPDFFHRLREHTSNLSTREMRLCAYGRLGMTNQEIAQTLGIETGSVSKARHRLKKKMNLEKEQDLNQFLAGL